MMDIDRVAKPRLDEFLFSKASKSKTPLSGTFELSPICNFSCKMCYVRKTAEDVRRHNRRMLTKEEWLDIARQAKEEGMLYLLLTGGEPFLWPDFWELYEELNRMGFLISINTNGSLLDEAAVERLKAMPPTRINITLYGADDETYQALCGAKGVFSRVDAAITALQEAGITVKLNGTLTPHNVKDLEKCIRYAESRDLIYQTNTYMFPPVRRDAEAIGENERFTPAEAAKYNLQSYRLSHGEEFYYKRLRAITKGVVSPPGLDESCIDPKDGTIRCRAGKASFWITWDGWMTPCGMMTEPKVDVTLQSFKENWQKLVDLSEKTVVSGICVKCPNQKLCHACVAMAMTETGRADGIPVYLCEMVREMKIYAEKELKEMKEEESI